jgi:uncharacterized protein YpuA (DUF1002 family)
MVSNIEREDVISVADNLGVKLTDKQIDKVIAMYNHEEECDPNSNWIEIVKNCINFILND